MIKQLLRKTKIFQLIKLLLFPGIDLHTRCRYKILPKYFLKGDITTLDAGCGNGCLAYAAYKNGNNVTWVSFEDALIERNRDFYNFLNVDSNRLCFKIPNLYKVEELGCKFDQTICSETLEHIKDDKQIIKSFYNILNAKCVLHLCCPYSLHPEHCRGRVNELEDGGHVRDAYTQESYEELLKSNGFKIVEYVGIGSPILVTLDNFIRSISSTFGELFFMPFSLYVKCVKK